MITPDVAGSQVQRARHAPPIGGSTPTVRRPASLAAVALLVTATVALAGAGAAAAAGLAFNLGRQRMPGREGLPMGLVPALWAVVAAWAAYLVYAVGWLPGSDWLQINRKDWFAGLVTLVSGVLTIPWSLKGRLRLPRLWG